MENELVRVSFCVELAKKITSSEVEGRIVTRDGRNVRILCFERNYYSYPIVALVSKYGIETVYSFTNDGKISHLAKSGCDLFIEIPRYKTFKDGDILFSDSVFYIVKGDVQYNSKGISCEYYCAIDDKGLLLQASCGRCFIKNPRLAIEEEKKKLIEKFEESKKRKADEYLKRFFGIDVKK